jgi:hypothetical protein
MNIAKPSDAPKMLVNAAMLYNTPRTLNVNGQTRNLHPKGPIINP